MGAGLLRSRSSPLTVGQTPETIGEGGATVPPGKEGRHDDNIGKYLSELREDV
jgi:hypothetical protein